MSFLDDQRISNLIELMTPDEFAELVNAYKKISAEHFVRLHQASAENDLKTFRFVTHTLKGSSANIGASALSEMLLQLEQEVSRGVFDSGVQAQLAKINHVYRQVLASLAEKVAEL